MATAVCNNLIDEHGFELVKHGNSAFPAACYDDDLAEQEVGWHWHQEFEFILLAEGDSVVTIGGEKYLAKEGDGVFINSEVLHAGFLADTPTCRYHSYVFHPALIGGGFESVFWNRYLYPLIENKSLQGFYLNKDIPEHKELLDALEHAWQCIAKDTPGFEFTVREALSKLIFSICTNSQTQQKAPSPKMLRDGERMKLMMQFISEHFSEEIIIADLAESALISESEVLRCFHNTIDSTPIQYVKQFRIHKAAALLSSTDLKITEIGSFCGFQEMSYFAKSFKKIYGCTPTQYRLQG